jgi:hypothetical protein
MAGSSRAVYYSTDDNLHCIYRLRRSIQSLREFNSKINVYVAYYGVLYEETRQFFEEHNVGLIYNPEKTNPYLARFFVLENDFPESELAYLDTDTQIFGDIEELFEKTGPQDFHARNAPLTERDGYPRRAGYTLVFKSIVNYDVYDYICKTLKIESLPFFNIGLMIFKNNFHVRLRSYFDEWSLLQSMFESKQFPYPCSNPHVSREIVTPLVLARIPNFSWSYIEPSLSPFFIEYGSSNIGTGTVMHIFSPFYGAYLLDFAGREETLKYLYLPRQKTAQVQFRNVVNKLMPVGGTASRNKTKKKLVKAWIRLGGWLYRYHRKKRAIKLPADQPNHMASETAAINSVK